MVRTSGYLIPREQERSERKATNNDIHLDAIRNFPLFFYNFFYQSTQTLTCSFVKLEKLQEVHENSIFVWLSCMTEYGTYVQLLKDVQDKKKNSISESSNHMLLDIERSS